jgi:hypothetical protein
LQQNLTTSARNRQRKNRKTLNPKKSQTLFQQNQQQRPNKIKKKQIKENPKP